MKRIITLFILNITYLTLLAQFNRDSILKVIHQVGESSSNFDKSYPLLQKILNLSIQHKDTHLIILTYQKLGDILWYKSIYGKSEDYYFKSLELIDSLKYPKEYAYALYSIGWIECVQKEKPDKLPLLKRALNISVLLKDTASMAVISNAISGSYMNFYQKDTLKKYFIDSAINAIHYIINSLTITPKWKFKLSQLEANLAEEYYQKREYLTAYYYINQTFSNPNLQNYKRNYLISILLKAKILNKLNYKDSVRYLVNKHFKELENINDNETLKDFYLLLYQIEKENKNLSKALDYFEKYQKVNEQINKELLSIKYEELEANKELFKKEQSILNLQKQTELQQIKNQQKSYIIFAILLSLLVISYFLRKSILQNKQIKKLHQKVSHQKNTLEQKNKDILDSINYASRIQKALITSDDYIQNHFIQNHIFQNYFVLYIPKDIVSGDFYWANANPLHNNQPHYLAVCDSTGHGVPGAFMSLLNINYLTEAVQEKHLYYPNEILNYVRTKLIQNLTFDEQQKDGMDATLLLFDNEYTNNKKIFYASAHQNILIVRQNEPHIVLEGDKMPVGLSHKKDSFNLYSFQLQKEDWIYLYTDGYKDQFGGKKGKRILHKNFIDILSKHSHLSPTDQKEFLSQFFLDWKRDLEQTDDITIFAFQV